MVALLARELCDRLAAGGPRAEHTGAQGQKADRGVDMDLDWGTTWTGHMRRQGRGERPGSSRCRCGRGADAEMAVGWDVQL